VFTSLIFGQVEYKTGIKLVCKQARQGQIDVHAHGPTDQGDTDNDDAVQKTFVQQRGQETNRLGETADKRALIVQGKIERSETGPTEVSEKGDEKTISSSFYGDE